MRKSAVRILLAAVAVAMLGSMAFAVTVIPSDPVKGIPSLDITGYQWIRYTGAFTDSSETGSGFMIPRTYITTQLKGTDYEGRLTLDINNVQYGEGVNTTVSSLGTAVQGGVDWEIWIKYAYVDLINMPGFKTADLKVRVGQQPVYFGEIDPWQYPTIEKTLEDVLGWVAGADEGVAVLGNLPMGLGDYQLQMVDGNGYKNIENNLGKELNAAINIVPIQGIAIRYSYQNNNPGEDSVLPNSMPTALYNNSTVQGIALNVGTGPIEGYLEGIQKQTKNSYTSGKETTSGIAQGVSAYMGIKVIDQAQLVLRYDTVNPDTLADKSLTSSYAPYNRYIFGVNYFIAKGCTLQLDYEMLQEKIAGSKVNPITYGPLSPTGALDSNANQLLAQLVWNW